MIAKTLDVLTARSWSSANIDDVVCAAVSFLQDNDRTRIWTNGPGI